MFIPQQILSDTKTNYNCYLTNCSGRCPGNGSGRGRGERTLIKIIICVLIILAIQAVDPRAALGIAVAVWATHVQMHPCLATPRHRIASSVATPPPSATPQSHALTTYARLKAENNNNNEKSHTTSVMNMSSQHAVYIISTVMHRHHQQFLALI